MPRRFGKDQRDNESVYIVGSMIDTKVNSFKVSPIAEVVMIYGRRGSTAV